MKNIFVFAAALTFLLLTLICMGCAVKETDPASELTRVEAELEKAAA